MTPPVPTDRPTPGAHPRAGARPTEGRANPNRPFVLLGVLAGVVTALCAVTWVGVLTLDAARAITRSESLYVAQWGLAFGHLDGFVRSNDVREYEKFERDLQIPLASVAARRALTAGEVDATAARRLLVRSGIDTADVGAVMRLYAFWRRTDVGERYLATRARADRDMLAILALGRRLRQEAAAGPLDSVEVAGALRELAVAEFAMQRHTRALHAIVSAAARQVRTDVLISLFAAAVLILSIAGWLVLRLMRGIERSEASFRATFENAAVGIANTGPDGAWLRVNDRLCEMLGYTREELLATTFQEMTPPEDIEPNLVLLRQALAGERDSYALEKRLIHRDGHPVWIHLTASLLRTDAGAPRYFISVIQDISERKRVEDALRRSEQQLKEALDTGRVFTFDWDLARDVIARSANATRALGFPPGVTEGTGAAFFEALHPEDRAPIEALIRGITPERPTFEALYRYIRPDGAAVVLNTDARGFFDADARPVRIVGLCADVTEQTHAEAALRESEGRFRQIAENLDGALWMLDADAGRLLYVSPTAERVWGAPLDTLLHDPMAGLDRVHEDDRPRVLAALAGPIADRTSVDFRVSGAGTGAGTGGDPRWLRVSAFPIRGADGVPTRIAGFAEDVTASVRYQEEREGRARAEDALRVKTAILHGVSEELRTPLTAILGFTTLLREGAESAETAEYAAIVERNARRLEQAVAGILELAQVESGAIPVRPEVVDVVAEAQAAAALLRPQARERGLTLEVHAETRPLHGLADRGSLQRILRTLIGSGLNATERGGVTLDVGATDDDVTLHVHDTSAGFEPAVLPYLFSGFHDAGWASDRSSVELALVKRLAEMLGGSLHVESAPGQGTTFTLRLPRAPAPTAQA
ncbi:MAG TPA: PAS domain S-box protein [Rhodothermales bacterium]|nr:PAS domain S-box protein [Rhodothermales bacterium]